MAQLKKTNVSLTHFSSFADTNTEYVSASFPALQGTAAMSVLCSFVSSFKEYGEFGDILGDVASFDTVLALSYAYFPEPSLAVGANLKGFYSKLYVYDKLGFAVDAGAFFILGKDPYTRAGIAVQNIGSQTAYIEVSDPLPANVKAGLSAKFDIAGVGNLLFAVDVNRLIVKDELPTLELGAEAELYEIIAIRLGYGLRHDAAGLSMGLGVLLEKLRFSYAFQPFDCLGTAHRITVDLEL
ncbi:MAG TPA: PorV/PorQ family protein [Candidatus Goldiibacteriota bacterium]|nr:PorV/PorQ family protein [Candidatus Goldiibacteriota bacterium]